MRRRRPVGVAVVFVVLSPLACSGDSGQSRSSQRDGTETPSAFPATSLPEARTEVAGALWGERIAVAGGFTSDGVPSARLDLLDRGGDWSRGPELPAAYDHASVAVLDGRLWLVGGYATGSGRSGEPTADVFSLGAGETQWRREAPLLRARGALATVTADGQLVAIGGQGGAGALASTEVYDPAEARWRPGPELRVAREHTAAAATSDTVYAIAGRQLSLESNLSSVESLRLGPDATWERAPGLLASRGGTAAAAVPTGPCVAGGEEPQGTIASVECLRGDRWEQVATLAVPRHGLAMVAVGDELHVLGGGPRPGLFVSNAHEVIEVHEAD